MGAEEREIITDKESGKSLDRPGYQAYECSEPDCRICNDPPEYVKLVRSEAVDHNLHKYDDDSGLD